ncbi:hypothetical protein ACFFHF_16480 [Robertmurraya beringensis]|uniref:Uncharacterized protein n=1 Tax=Robertmurraya beringensis TaxID=641660 RepID=A0ABV6KV74_9BACI
MGKRVSMDELPVELQKVFKEYCSIYPYLLLNVVKCTHSEIPLQKGKDHHYQIYASGKEGSFVIFHLPILDVPNYESKVETTFFTLDDLKVFFLDSEEGRETLDKLTSAIL